MIIRRHCCSGKFCLAGRRLPCHHRRHRLVHAEFSGRMLPGWIEAEHDPKQATHNAKLYSSRTLGTLHSWPLWTLMFPNIPTASS